MNYNWLKILKGFKMGYFTRYYYGLTPRFILGCCQNPIGEKFDSPELAKEATLLMFNEMKNFNDDNLIVVSSVCPDHEGRVLNLSNEKWSPNSIGTTFEDLWERYGTEIVTGNYSIDTEERGIVERIFKEL